MQIKKLQKPVCINNSSPVRLKETGNVTEILYSQKRSAGGCTIKIDKNNYIDLRTGELKQFNHIVNRSQDLSNVAKSLSYGRDLLNTNIIDVRFCRWITLTYADNMTDPKKLYNDFKNFNTRLRDIVGHYEYITAAEPQARGAWHLHVVLIFSSFAPFIPNNVVSDCWKQGFVKVKRLDDVDNVGAYLTAYLGDMELSEIDNFEQVSLSSKVIKEVEYTDEDGEKKKKKYIKGARLYMYPSGFHIFRCSRGIKKPIISIVSYEQAKEKVCSAKQTFTKTVVLEDEKNGFKNTLQYEYYNSIRK